LARAIAYTLSPEYWGRKNLTASFEQFGSDFKVVNTHNNGVEEEIQWIQTKKLVAQGTLATTISVGTIYGAHLTMAAMTGGFSVTLLGILAAGAGVTAVGATNFVAWDHTRTTARVLGRMRVGPSALLDELYEGR
jgi:hypothetical protein